MIVYSILIDTPLGQKALGKAKERSTQKSLNRMAKAYKDETGEEASDFQRIMLADKADEYGEANARSTLTLISSFIDGFLAVITFRLLWQWAQSTLPGVMAMVVTVSIAAVIVGFSYHLVSRQKEKED